MIHPFSPDDHSEWEPPDPMPNSAVKPLSADGSVGPPHARVGHRQAFIPKTPASVEAGVFLSIGTTRCRHLYTRGRPRPILENLYGMVSVIRRGSSGSGLGSGAQGVSWLHTTSRQYADDYRDGGQLLPIGTGDEGAASGYGIRYLGRHRCSRHCCTGYLYLWR